MAGFGFITTLRLGFPGSRGKPTRIHSNQWGVDETIFLIEPVSFLHAARCKSIDLTEPLCHSGISNHAAALLSLLNFNCFQAQRVSASLPLIFFFDKLSPLMSGAG